MAYTKATHDDWLLKAATMGAGDIVNLYPRGELTAIDARLAIKAQGLTRRLVYQHGNRLWVERLPDPSP